MYIFIYLISRPVALLKINVFRFSSNCMKFYENFMWVLIVSHIANAVTNYVACPRIVL